MTTPLHELAATFRAANIRWVLIGAHAANRYRAAARTTQDIDVLLLDPIDVNALTSALDKAGWRSRGSGESDLLRVLHPELGPLDIIVAGTDYQRLAVARARHEEIDGVADIPVLTIEDVVLHKLIAGRYRDLADIETILATRPSLDQRYLSEWISYWELAERWRSVVGGDASAR